MKFTKLETFKLDKNWVLKKLPRRSRNANKGTFGKILVIAGSKNFPGAAYLASAACYRIGAGLVTLVTSNSVKTIISNKLPEATFLPPNLIDQKIKEYDVILIGPGLGQQDKSIKLVEKLIKEKSLKIIIDADGLNILARKNKWWEKLKASCILTPHPGEMSRLTGLSTNKIQSSRENIAYKYAKKWNQIVVLKGANTTVASPKGGVATNPFANPVLATAGTGDILAGIITGLVSQGLKNFDAACVGCFIHGTCGELIGKKMGSAGALASDLLPLIPKVLFNISKQRI